LSAATKPRPDAHPHARAVLIDIAEPTVARLPLWDRDYKP